MSNPDPVDGFTALCFRDVFGVYVLTPDEVQFRTGSMSGPVYQVSDPERRGLLGPVLIKLISGELRLQRPWNEAELEILEETVPELRDLGIVDGPTRDSSSDDGVTRSQMFLRPRLAEARIAIVGHGVLGEAVRQLFVAMPCGAITVVESTSVAPLRGLNRGLVPLVLPLSDLTGEGSVVPKPRTAEEWSEILSGHDWVIAAQDCFEPEELASLSKAALKLSLPWSLVCFDGHEGWIGPTFVPGQTACFNCFRRRLYAAAADPTHVFMDPGVKVHRIPSPWSAGVETGAWVSLIASIFALEVVAAADGRSFTLDHMLTVHRLNMTFQRESVRRLPRCTDCSGRGDAPALNVFAHLLETHRATPNKLC